MQGQLFKPCHSTAPNRWTGLVGALAVRLVLLLPLASGCASHKPVLPPRPDVAPSFASNDAEPLQLDASHIKPMYTEMLPVDLPTVVRVAGARNFDIQRAREAVTASRGRLESAIGAAFPAIVPTALFDQVEGTVRATEGDLVGVGFHTFQPSIAVQWVVNPGRVIYDIIAAKKRLWASQQQEDAVLLDTLRSAAVQYYDLVLAQARVSAAHQSVLEADELLRINRLRTQTGIGVHADELRAEAKLAQQRQGLILAMRAFYDASVALTVTLHLDATVTLIPSIDEVPPARLVRDDLPIQELLAIATTFRADLQGVRTLAAAAAAEKGATWWSGFGPELNASYQYGGITGNADNTKLREGIPGNLIVNPASATGLFSANPIADGLIREGILRGSQRLDGREDQTFSFSDQQRSGAGISWRLSLAAFGDLKRAGAEEALARLEALRALDEVAAQVVRAGQASRANHDLIELAHQQVAAARESLRLSEANLRAGTFTTLDVLQAQDAVTHARLSHAEAVVRFNQSQVNLLAALGLLDEASLLPQPEESDRPAQQPPRDRFPNEGAPAGA